MKIVYVPKLFFDYIDILSRTDFYYYTAIHIVETFFLEKLIYLNSKKFMHSKYPEKSPVNEMVLP